MYKCPNYVIALLKDLDDYLSVCYWNKNQKTWQSPLSNTGNSYSNPTFELRAYSWNDDNEWNFKYNNGGVILEWYKHIGRCTCVNKDLLPADWVEIYDACIEAIRKDFGKYAPDGKE